MTEQTTEPDSRPRRGATTDTAETGRSLDPVAALAGMDLPAKARELIERLVVERDEAVAGRMRAQADFVNFQRRATENESLALRRGAGSVVRTLLPVLDHVDLALLQDAQAMTTSQLMDAVHMMREELTKALEGHGVSMIDPAPGEEFDPMRHHAVMREHTNRLPPDSVVAVLQVGYAVDEIVLRPATVTVAAPPEDAEE